MIVKDAEESIRDCLATVQPLISRYLIIDTGSTDDTKKVARQALRGVKGSIMSRPWRGFAENRSELLRLARRNARPGEYLLMLDADHLIQQTGPAPDFTADAYRVTVNGTGGLQWRLPLLTRAAHPFQYRGAAHAYLHSDDSYIETDTDWLTVDGGAGATPEKLQRDIAALEQAHLADPTNARTVFYLAMSHEGLDELEKAISYYRLRANMNGWDEERFYARYRLGCLLAETVSFEQGAAELLEAWRDRPGRAEPLRALAHSANAVADKTPVPPDALFLSPAAYLQEALT